jgi:hypothetical protein
MWAIEFLVGVIVIYAVHLGIAIVSIILFAGFLQTLGYLTAIAIR